MACEHEVVAYVSMSDGNGLSLLCTACGGCAITVIRELREQLAAALRELIAEREAKPAASAETDAEHMTDLTEDLGDRMVEISPGTALHLSAELRQAADALDATRAKLAEAEAALTDARADRERLEVQLAGCGVAALGWSRGNDEAKQGDYGWSASYGDVVTIRKELEKARAELTEAHRALEAIEREGMRVADSCTAIAETAELARRKGGST